MSTDAGPVAASNIAAEWAKGADLIASLRVGEKIRHRNGMVAHVRAVLPDDEVAVVRTWSRKKQRWTYIIVDPADFIYVLWMRKP